jgi:ProP effector
MKNQALHPRTEGINRSQKHQSKLSRTDALSWLAQKFPLAFDNTTRIMPLKTGIMHDILAYSEEALALGYSKSKLRQAVVLFTRRVDYLACLKAKEMRVDLQGEPFEAVSEEDAEKAATKIKRRVEKSARNARKNLAGKIPPYYQTKPAPSSNQPSFPKYPERSTGFSAQIASVAPQRPMVTVKHKATRAYDPEAVARLKEKLGLSMKKELA